MLESPLGSSRVYLLRHAQSGWAQPGESDIDRPLDAIGRKQADRMALTMMVNGYVPELVLCSPARRCVETLAALAQRLTRRVHIVHDKRLYTGDDRTYVELIGENAAVSSVLLVGHNPMMEMVAARLTRTPGRSQAARPETIQPEEDALERGFPTAGLMIVDFPGPLTLARQGHGTTVGFLTPEDA